MRLKHYLMAALTMVVVLAAAGTIEAIRLETPMLAVLFAAIAIVAASIARACRDRTVFSLRPDLANWAEQTSAHTGERPEQLVDRAVSAYRADFEPSSPVPDRATVPSDDRQRCPAG